VKPRVIDRASRSLLRNYAEQIDALGPRRWFTFKIQRLRARRARPGVTFSVSTPLAGFPLQFRAQTSDTNVFSQIFLHREYRCIDDIGTAGLIIDCGANVGYSSAYLLSRFPTATLVAIEPDPANFELMRANLRPYEDRCEALNSAVWSTTVGLVVDSPPIGARQEWAVTVRPAHDGERPTIEAVDLGTILERSGFDRISILKVDIEGSEAEVFSRHTESWLPFVDNLVIECHGEHCRTVVLSAIEGLGFEVSQCEELMVCRR
jgi:FkbM family methyltransferase